jgi:hypothetical protein
MVTIFALCCTSQVQTKVETIEPNHRGNNNPQPRSPVVQSPCRTVAEASGTFLADVSAVFELLNTTIM